MPTCQRLDDDGECRDLISDPAFCALCTGTEARQKAQQEAGKQLEIGTEMYWFQSNYSGRCARCEKAFEIGDWIARTSNGKYVCCDDTLRKPFVVLK